MEELNSLSDMQRRAYLFGFAYARERQKRQKFYKPWPDDSDFKEHPVFKACVTVTTWLEEQRVHVAWSEITWGSFIAFAFETLAPTIPQPGQLKNFQLLRDYFKSSPQTAVTSISSIEIDALYKKHLLPEIANDPKLLEWLGLGKIKPKDEK